jgi:hypothetical protein
VHVRRGDYVELEKEGFWNLGADYYRPALQRIRTAAAGGPQRILLLSDDLAWCSQQPWITEEGFEAADEPDELTALALMSMCGGGAVIANSTFSWWGAYLSAASTVVYPSLWLKDWAPELFPAGWICQKLQPRPPAT